MSIDPKTLPGVVFDDAEADLKGTWKPSSGFKPYVGNGYVHDDKLSDGQSQATFRTKSLKPGHYDLRMAYSPHPTRATNVPVTITSGGKTTTITVDQTKPLPPGEALRTVGSVEIQNEGETVITVINKDTDGFVILDALELVPSTQASK